MSLLPWPLLVKNQPENQNQNIPFAEMKMEIMSIDKLEENIVNSNEKEKDCPQLLKNFETTVKPTYPAMNGP